MRLVCPNCEAKYEVPEDAIPDTGRDVQCTNCGHSWYQMRGRTAAAPLVAPAPVEPAVAAAEPVTEPVPAKEPSDTPASAVVAETVVVDTPPAIEAATEVETKVISDTVEDAVSEAASLEEPPVAEAAAEPVPEEVRVDTVAAEVDIAALQDAEPVAESVPEVGAEPVAETVPEVDAEPVAEIIPEVVAEPLVEIVPDVAEVVASAETVADAEPMPEPSPIAEIAALAEATVVADEATEPQLSEPEATAEAASDTVADVTPAPAPDYAVDDSVLAILREEAEREANARRAEALESQTDLGIDTAMPPKAAVVAEVEAKPAARRDLLPDVEEINSTLRPSEMQVDADGTPDFVAPPPEAPRGFRSGFLSLMTIAILAAALYLVAPRLAVMVPALAGPLESYVSVIDSLRLGLDGMMRSATVAISDG